MDLKTICRICLSQQTGQMISIFKTVKQLQKENDEIFTQIANKLLNDIAFISENNPAINDMVNAFNSYEMFDIDGFPDKICCGCIEDLCLAYAFKLRCSDAYYKIKQHLLTGYDYARCSDEAADNDSESVSSQTLVEQHTGFIEGNEVDESETKASIVKINETFGTVEKNIEKQLEVKNTDCQSNVMSGNHDTRSTCSDGDFKEIKRLSIENNDDFRGFAELVEVKEEVTDVANLEEMDEVASDHSNEEFFELLEVYEVSDEIEPEPELRKQLRQIKANECSRCSKKCGSFLDLVSHMRNQCVTGSQAASAAISNTNESESEDSKSETDDIECPECHRIFIKSQDFERHKLTHVNQPSLDCDNCGRRFRHLRSLKRHKKLIHERSHKCDICGKDFREKVDFYLHRNEHSDREIQRCKNCGRKFLNMQQHLESCSTNRSKLKTNSKIKSFQCEICSKSFYSYAGLSVHSIVHIRRTVNCNSCSKRFQSREELAEHTKEHGLLCTHCGKLLDCASDYGKHMMKHTGDKPYKCDYCDKSFRRPANLKTHINYHLGIKPFACATCDKKFYARNTLVNHLRTHTGERPYKCTHCDKSFTQHNDLKVHIRRHTGERLKCSLCNESFIRNHLLNRHKRKVHGCDIQPKSTVVRLVTIDKEREPCTTKEIKND